MKIHDAIDRSVQTSNHRTTRWLTYRAFKQSSTDCVLRATSRVALAIYTTKRRLCRTPSDQKTRGND
jgi:hypothetical protein